MSSIDTPIANWGFEASLTDSASGFYLADLGDPSSFVAGKLGSYALKGTSGTGNGNQVATPALNFGVLPFSVAFWVKWDTLGSDRLTLVFQGAGDVAWGIGVSSDAVVFGSGGASLASLDTSVSANWTDGAVDAPVNIWMFVCATYDGDTVRLYLDGKDPISTALASLVDAPDGALTLQCIDSAVDGLYVYDYALSGSEVASLYNATSCVVRELYEMADETDEHGIADLQALFATTAHYVGSGGKTGDYLDMEAHAVEVRLFGDTAVMERSWSRVMLVKRVDSAAVACLEADDELEYQLDDDPAGDLVLTVKDEAGDPYTVDTTKLAEDAWTLLCYGVDFDASTVWISKNGAAKVTSPFSGTSVTPNYVGDRAPVLLERSSHPEVTEAVPYPNDGYPDEFLFAQWGLFAGALTAGDITWLYNSGSYRTAAEILARFVGGLGYEPGGGATGSTFLDVDFPDIIELGSTVSRPGFDTVVVGTPGGRFEQRIARNVNPRRRFEATIQFANEDEIEMLAAFFNLVRGKLNSFRFRDWSDYTLGGYVDGTGFHVDTPVPTTRINAKKYQIRKVYTFGPYASERVVTKPQVGTVKVYKDGVLQTTGYVVDHLTGVITFDSSLADGVVVSAACLFDVPCRLDTDEPEVALRSVRAGSVASLSLVEVAE